MSASAQPIFDYQPGVSEHDPELYQTAETAPTLDGWGAIGEAEIEAFHRDGYLAIENAFTPDEVAAARAGLDDLMRGRNPDFKKVMYENVARDKIDSMSEDERAASVRKLFDFTDYDARLGELVTHARMTKVLSTLMRGGVPKLFQSMALLKPPRIGREKPWHQDQAYFDYPVDTPVVGAWIALDEVTPENGCMHVVPGAHRAGPQIHFKVRDWQICDTEMRHQRVVAVPLKPGGCLLFSGLLPHGTPTNRSPKPRWSLQYHYLPEGTQKCSTEARLELFGSEGKDVTC